MVSTAIQLFTVCESNKSLSTILDQIADAGYDGVEYNEEWFPLRGRTDGDQDALPDSSGRLLTPVGVQVPLSTLEKEFEDLVSVYEKLSCRNFVVPYLNADYFESRQAVRKAADRLNAVADRLADHGVRLHYHNHHFEFITLGDRLAFDVLVDATDGVRFEVDVGWVAAAGRDPVTILERHADVIDLVHLKDMNVESETPTQLGGGDVDLKACIDAAADTGAEWVIYEYDWPPDPDEAIVAGGEWFQSRIE